LCNTLYIVLLLSKQKKAGDDTMRNLKQVKLGLKEKYLPLINRTQALRWILRYNSNGLVWLNVNHTVYGCFKGTNNGFVVLPESIESLELR
jgi:hypothetical protein